MKSSLNHFRLPVTSRCNAAHRSTIKKDVVVKKIKEEMNPGLLHKYDEYLFLQSLLQELPQHQQEEAEREFVKAMGHTESEENGFGKIEVADMKLKDLFIAQYLVGIRPCNPVHFFSQ